MRETSRRILGAVLCMPLLLAGVGISQAADGSVRGFDAPIRFEVADTGLLQVNGEARYLDTIELLPRRDGAVLVNELGIDDYVAGIAEMPADWPMEALKAQAVAARTYGWYVMRTGSYAGYDICATVACQVFRGADVEFGTGSGDRWRAAVEETAGEVLVDDEGDPVLARYYSTSGGRTYANEEVFPSSGSHDHLVSIEDPYDAVSPLHRWTVRFTREEFDAIAARGQQLSSVVPVADAERVGEVHDPRASIRVQGQDGTVVEVGTGNFRDFVSAVAPELFPDRFPPLRADGLRSLPSTVPTARYDIEVTDDEVILHGQGWGHGVGMGQYGAKGRAQEGATYREILAAYYNGLEPARTAAVPERLRVGIAVGGTLSVAADAPVRIEAGDEVIEEGALGTWQLDRQGDGWLLTPPEGHSETLEVSDTRTAQALRAMVDAVAVEIDVNKPVRLALEVTTEADRTVIRRDLGVVEAGRHSAVWRLDDADGSLAEPGRYRVALVAQDHTGDRAGEPIEIELPLVAADSPVPDRPEAATDPNRWWLVTVAAGVFALLAAGLIVIRRAR